MNRSSAGQMTESKVAEAPARVGSLIMSRGGRIIRCWVVLDDIELEEGQGWLCTTLYVGHSYQRIVKRVAFDRSVVAVQ
jgi:hypothetical protein